MFAFHFPDIVGFADDRVFETVGLILEHVLPYALNIPRKLHPDLLGAEWRFGSRFGVGEVDHQGGEDRRGHFFHVLADELYDRHRGKQ